MIRIFALITILCAFSTAFAAKVEIINGPRTYEDPETIETMEIHSMVIEASSEPDVDGKYKEELWAFDDSGNGRINIFIASISPIQQLQQTVEHHNRVDIYTRKGRKLGRNTEFKNGLTEESSLTVAEYKDIRLALETLPVNPHWAGSYVEQLGNFRITGEAIQSPCPIKVRYVVGATGRYTDLQGHESPYNTGRIVEIEYTCNDFSALGPAVAK